MEIKINKLYIIGSGIAGLSAACLAKKKKYSIELFEGSAQSGGRCRSYYDKNLDMEIDNGNHLILSANTNFLKFCKLIDSEKTLKCLDSSFNFFNLKNKSKSYERRGICNFVWRLTGELSTILKIKPRPKVSICEDLKNSDVVITTPSTVLLEAMIAKRPVAIIDYTNNPSYIQTAWSITHVEQIENTLNELLQVPKEKMNFQNVSLSDSLQLKESANKRMIELIEKMSLHSENCKAKGNDLRFPTKILND